VQDRASASRTPIRIAIVNDYEVVVRGLRRLLEPWAHRIKVGELDSATPVAQPVDVALYDTFSHERIDRGGLGPLLENPHVGRVVVYTWLLDEEILAAAGRHGVAAVIPKRLGGEDLVAAIEAAHRGEQLLPTTPETGVPEVLHGSWPGKEEGLTPRQSEMLALIVQGLSNKQIAERTLLSANTIKSYIRSAYWRMGVTTRSQAVLWGLDHGFHPSAQANRIVLD
jgi:DNA-binding NarL/FixJ family response regulator